MFLKVSGIPDRHANINPASRAQFLASPASRGTVKSRIPSIYLSFSRFPHRILVKSRIPKIPFQTLLIELQVGLKRTNWLATPLTIAGSTLLFSRFSLEHLISGPKRYQDLSRNGRLALLQISESGTNIHGILWRFCYWPNENTSNSGLGQ